MRTRRGRRTSRPAPPSGSGVVELDRPRRSAGEGDAGSEQSVVRPDEDTGAAADLDGNRLAARADAGIDDGEHNALGEVGIGLARASEPARTSNGLIPWVRSMVDA